MAYDVHKNFSYGTVATAPSPASSGTSLTVQSGQGASFPLIPFNATVWPANALPTSGNAEIIRVTGIASDNFSTIIRTQEGTSARSIIVGDQIMAGPTAKTFSDIENLTYNPYKFLAYQAAALNTPTGGAAVIKFDTKTGIGYDTGVNYSTSTGLFTAPVAGFYVFQFNLQVGVILNNWRTWLYKNGAAFMAGLYLNGSMSTGGGSANLSSPPISLAASDTIGVYCNASAAVALDVGSAPIAVYFGGSLISLT